MKKEVVFLDTDGGSRGGLLVGIGVQTKEKFLQSLDKWNEVMGGRYCLFYPDCRFAYIDGEESKKFKNTSVAELEEIFTAEDFKRMGRLMEYEKGSYPIFRKAVYEKYGYIEGDCDELYKN